MTTEAIITFKSKKGAQNYIKRLGYEPGVEAEDEYWNGSQSVPVRITFTIVRVADEFVVQRTVEEV